MVKYGMGPKAVCPDERFHAPGQADRAAGAMVGMACGDALGAGYEFGGPYPDHMPIEMKGGGAFDWEPGEWTDDTSMAIPLLTLRDRMRSYCLDPVVDQWIDWARDAKDVGNQTRAVLGDARRRGRASATGSGIVNEGPAANAMAAAAAYQKHFPDAAGNGSLMRTAPAGLAGFYGPVAVYAQAQSALTHPHQDAREACALWSAAITHAVLTGDLDIRVGLYDMDFEVHAVSSGGVDDDAELTERIELWESRIAEAEANPPVHFSHNGWVVHALQAAWSSIVHSGDRADNDPRHLQRALELAVRSGGDTDTVAAIAGGLIGASYGVSAVPLDWKRRIHGWPGWRSEELIENAIEQARLVEYSEEGDSSWPLVDRMNYAGWDRTDTCVQSPHDSGLYLGGVLALDDLPRDVDAVVSLCRVGRKQIPDQVSREDRVAVWLPDAGDPAGSAHLDYVLTQAADMVATLRAEGHTVLLHCVQAYSRTPTVAALYAARHRGVDPTKAMDQVVSALSGAHPNPAFRAAYRRITSGA